MSGINFELRWLQSWSNSDLGNYVLIHGVPHKLQCRELEGVTWTAWRDVPIAIPDSFDEATGGKT